MLPAHHCPGSDRVSECLSCNGVILVQERGHRPPPPLPNFTWGSGESVTFLRSLYVASYTEESITLLRFLYVASYPVKSITLLRSMYVASYPVKSITFLRSLYVAGYPEEFIIFLLVGGDVFLFTSVFGDGWPNVCAIDAEPPFTERQ